jgi:hypothetical protein
MLNLCGEHVSGRRRATWRLNSREFGKIIIRGFLCPSPVKGKQEGLGHLAMAEPFGRTFSWRIFS